MISADELANLVDGTRWDLVTEDEAAALLSELRREIALGHVLESDLDKIRFVASDGGSDDFIAVVSGSNVAAWGIHLTYSDSREELPTQPWAWRLETVEDVRALIDGDEFI